MHSDYEKLTIKEVNIIFLKYKYSSIKPSTYGAYQFKAKIINEYFGDELIVNINKEKIRQFEEYLYKRKWEYTENISKATIKLVIDYLRQLLYEASKWKKIDAVSQEENEKNIDDELKRASSKISIMLN